ncbi:hypothetical protein EPUS_09148 [Endocarpon pusillum Z07020]|uniref:Carboxylic ester hydrolase n=1 Tax=Endocarpon pusillum (strain Z07020 / HMAS-L-300199) TaxID=1263415 RepID=U1HLI9_ENDPU|nr:uncharacterized protein EPUS_09148 [Endocarpon pusillum Z07020]ERF71125.1 hypothetical protein EPUS_09148 [Endocarpon pusillum Z07020]
MVTEHVKILLPSSSVPPNVQQIVGIRSSHSSDVEEFRGIPYGIVTERWESPKLADHLPCDSFDGSRHGPKCPQPAEPNNTEIFQSHLDYSSEVAESELDCLNLFIARPSAAALHQAGSTGEDGLPVMVWIHGGGYGYGAGSDPPWDPSRVILQSVKVGKPFIAVYINYRLNLFGFGASSELLETQSDSSFKGCNFGLQDQHVALQWVSKNISAFGGDPNRITIAGQSAGGISVHAQVLEAKSNPRKPLFQRAIVQSGAMGTVGPISAEEADSRWMYLCQHLHITHKSEKERVDFLRKMPASDMVRIAGEIKWFSFPLVAENKTVTMLPDGGVKVVLEPRSDAVNQGMEDEPIKVLIGDCDGEGMIWLDSISKIRSYDEIRSVIEHAYTSKSLVEAVLEAYHITAQSQTEELHRCLLQFMTDAKFGLPVHSAIRSLASHNRIAGEIATEVQAYRIKYTNPFSGILSTLAHHCVDLLYIFDAFYEDLAKAEPSSEALVEAMQQHWIDFIWDGCQPETSNYGVSEDDITVYERDRTRTVRKLNEDPECIERAKRLGLLAQDPAGMRTLWGMLSGVIPRS